MLKELVALEPGKPVLREYEDGPVPDGHIRVRVEYGAPKHGTEMALFRGEDPHLDHRFDEDYRMFFKNEPRPEAMNEPYLIRMGNMWVGRVAEIGKGVSGISLGQRVAGYGPLRNTHTVSVANAFPVDEAMNWKAAVSHDPAQFALGGVRDGNVRLGDAVAVSGLGAIGLIAAQMAKLSGASFVAVIDPIEKRRRAALLAGADLALDPMACDAGLELKKATGKRGMDVAIETSGSYPALQQVIRGIAYGGRVSIVGWYKECKGGLNLGREAHFNQPDIIMSRACNEINRDYPRWDFPRIGDTCWKLLCDGRIDCEHIVDPVVPLAESPAAYLDIDRHPEKSVKLGVKFI